MCTEQELNDLLIAQMVLWQKESLISAQLGRLYSVYNLWLHNRDAIYIAGLERMASSSRLENELAPLLDYIKGYNNGD